MLWLWSANFIGLSLSINVCYAIICCVTLQPLDVRCSPTPAGVNLFHFRMIRRMGEQMGSKGTYPDSFSLIVWVIVGYVCDAEVTQKYLAETKI